MIEMDELTRNEMNNQIPHLDELEKVVSDDGTYIIPVEWTVYSTVRVSAKNLKEAIELAFAKKDELPVTNLNEYVDDSYRINLGNSADEDTTLALTSRHISDVELSET